MRTASLVIQTSFLGDVVLTTPLIAELARRGPVDVVVTPAGAGLLAGNPDVRTIITYDKRGAGRGARGFAAIAARVRALREGDARAGGTAAYLAQGSSRSAALALLAGFGERVGFDTSAGRWLYTRRVAYREDRHHAERLWRLAFTGSEPADPDAATLKPRLFPGERDRALVDLLLAEHRYESGPLVVLAPGSAWATKRWPYYPDLARQLASDARIAIVGGRDEGELARAIVEAAPTAIDATGRFSLLASAELIGRADALVTNDSAPQHLASAMGTATVSLFGPTVPDFGFGPLAPRSSTPGVVGLDCRPCDRHGPRRCPLGHWRCMRDLEAGVVAGAVRVTLLGRAAGTGGEGR